MSDTKKTIFITGATGFVGNHLAEALIKEGHDVYILVRSIHKLNDFPLPGAKIISGDLNENHHAWINELPEKLDIVYHCAGLVHSMRRKYFYRHNTYSTERLFKDLIQKYEKNPLHFIFLSSLAATGPSLQGRFVNEESKNLPVSLYGKSKNDAEKILTKNCPTNFKLTIIRPPMVIGPRDTAVLDIFKMVQSNLIITPGMNGLNKEYSFICVFDLIDALIRTAMTEREKQTEIFFFSYPKKATFKEIIQTIKKAMGKSFVIYLLIPMPLVRILARLLKIIWGIYRHNLRLTPDKVRELTPTSWCAESEKSVRLLNMKYKYDLETTIKETLEDYYKRNWV